MKILPVIDLKGGVVVRGVAGRRDEYRPIVSKLCADATPATVARGLRETFGFDECYVADLDAIAGGEAFDVAYSVIDHHGLRPWIDAGPCGPAAAGGVACFAFSSCRMATQIVGLESLPDDVSYVESIAWDATLALSLDLMHGRPLTKINGWNDWSPERIAEFFVARGARTMIVLDLAAVGVGAGVPTLDLCRRLRAKYPKLELVSGGGVRDVDDLKRLRDAGCDYALVASALHDGRITPAALAAADL